MSHFGCKYDSLDMVPFYKKMKVDKILQNFDFLWKIRFLTKISIFDQNFDC